MALGLIALAGWGLTKIPTGFIPAEDQGYLMVAVQVPDAASLARTESVMDEIARIGLKTPGVERAIAIGTGGPSPLDGDVSLANAGIVYLMLKNWDERGKARISQHIYNNLADATRDGAGGAHAFVGSAAHSGSRRVQWFPDAGGID